MRTPVELAVFGPLHVHRRNLPDFSIQIDIGSFHLPDVAWALEKQGRELQCCARDRLAGLGIDGAHQRAGFSGFEHRRHVLDGDWREHPVKIGRRIALASPRNDAMAEDLARALAQRVRRFVGPTVFDSAQHLEQYRRALESGRLPSQGNTSFSIRDSQRAA